MISLSTGKVIGINSASYSKLESEGLGFAVPIVHACRVIKLLEQGVDPSPAHVPVSFAIDKDNEEDLVVAVVYQKQPVVWPLQSGDRIIAPAATPDAKFKNQADLIHALRGKTGDVSLLIERSGKKKTVVIKSLARPNLIKRIGVHASGIIFGPNAFKDDEVMNPKNLLFVHGVVDASIGSLSEVRAYSYLVSVDGQEIQTAGILCRYLSDAQSKEKKVRFLMRRRGWDYRAQSKYSSHEITVEDVKLIGPEAPEGCSS